MVKWFELDPTGQVLSGRPPMHALVGGSVLLFVVLLVLLALLARASVQSWLP